MPFIPTEGFDRIVSSSTSSSSPPSAGTDDSVDDAAALRWYCPPEQWKVGDKDDDDKDDGNDDGVNSNGWWKVVPRPKDDDDDDEEEKDGQAADDDELKQPKQKKAATRTCLQLAPPPKRDFWRKTYYQPLLVKDDGPFLYRTINISQDLPIMIETKFTIDNKSQFDQAGIMVRIDHNHWIKAGIEVVDNIPRLSCVVTNDFSDWSTQTWPTPSAQIRVHVLPQHGGSIVVEAVVPGIPTTTPSRKSSSWSFIRIAHLNQNMKHDLLNDESTVTDAYQGSNPPNGSMMVGLFGACPVAQHGMVVTFDHLSITHGSTFVHDA